MADAEAEGQAAGQWYELRRPGLGGEFLAELIEGLTAIERTPHRFPRINAKGKREFRRYALSRFPYHIVYEIRDGVVWVLALAHAHRRPGYWKKRIP